MNLLNGGTYQRHIEGESWLLINDLLDKALVGEADPVQSMLDAGEEVNRMLARWQEQLDKGDVSR